MKANEIKANGNCKKVRCITNGNLYGSVTEAAKAAKVAVPSMCYALKHKSKCKGNEYRFEYEMYRFAPKMGERISELTAENEILKAKAEAWDKYLAEKEAEEKRLTRETEARNRAIAKQEAKVDRLEAKWNRRKEALQKALREEQEAYAEYCKEIEKLNELNTSETVEWEVV